VTPVVYASSPTKRQRRNNAELNVIREAIHLALAADHPMTVRQVFYRLVIQGVIEKSEKEYKGTICRMLTDMRLSGAIPFGWIADNTRWMRRPLTYSSVKEALQHTAANYRRSLWDNQDDYVEVWLEKDALAGVLYPVTSQWQVPLMVSRGFSSLSYLHEAAQAIQSEDKPAHLYYFGDRDPSGVHIDRNIERRLREFAPEAEIHFQRVAVTEAQIEELALPTRPTKTSDSRSKGFKGESVELDAIPPAALRELVAGCIVQHVDQRRLPATQPPANDHFPAPDPFLRESAHADHKTKSLAYPLPHR
jgi:hypothetical protein